MNPEDAPVLDPLSQRIDAALRQEPPAPLPQCRSVRLTSSVAKKESK